MFKKHYVMMAAICFAALLLLAAFRDEDRPAVQKWDYKYIYLSRKIGGDWALYEGETRVSVGMMTYMRQLGEQGWELVSVAPSSDTYHEGFSGTDGSFGAPSFAGFTSTVDYYFKRPKQ